MPESLDGRLKAVFADAFETTPDGINENLSTDSSEEWDSMRSVVLAQCVEAEFDVEFSDEELVALDSYQKIRATLLAKGVT